MEAVLDNALALGQEMVHLTEEAGLLTTPASMETVMSQVAIFVVPLALIDFFSVKDMV